MPMILDPNWRRGYLIPYGRDKRTGQGGMAVPGVIQDMLSAVMAPGEVYQNPLLMIDPDTGRTSDYAIQRSADLAGMMTLGSGAIPADKNSLRMGIKAYHGSPHDFDRFSMDKIGTGEGAQAYGHGLYFAENEGVARNYRDTLARPPANEPIANAWDIARLSGGDLAPTIKALDEGAAYARSTGQNVPADFMERTVAALRSGEYKSYQPPGRMYEVNIDANPDDFLDWDRPLSEQGPKVRQFLDDYRALGADIPEDNATGAQLYSRTIWNSGKDDSKWAKGIGPDKQYAPNASDALRREGIPGIKYLDAGSRSAGDGSRNYVVFDENLISIVKKYGVAALVAAGVLDQVQGEELKARGYN